MYKAFARKFGSAYGIRIGRVGFGLSLEDRRIQSDRRIRISVHWNTDESAIRIQLNTAVFTLGIQDQDIATVAGSVAYLLASAAISELFIAYFALEIGLRDMLRKQRPWGLGAPPQT